MDKVANDGLSNGDADGKGVVADSESVVKPVNGNPAQPGSGGGSGVGGSESKNGGSNQTSSSSLLNVLADVALSKETKTTKSKNGYGAVGTKNESGDGTATVIGSDGESDLPSDEEEGGEEHFSTLRELLIRPAPKTNSSKNADQNAAPPVPKRQRMETLEDVISCVIERGVDREPTSPEPSNSSNNVPPAPPGSSSNSSASVSVAATSSSTSKKETTNGEMEDNPVNVKELVHFKRRGDAFKTTLTRGLLPPRIMVLTESSKDYPDIPHSWLCNGKLLRLHDPKNPNNYKIFQVIKISLLCTTFDHD